jgi:hypothetical protein
MSPCIILYHTTLYSKLNLLGRMRSAQHASIYNYFTKYLPVTSSPMEGARLKQLWWELRAGLAPGHSRLLNGQKLDMNKNVSGHANPCEFCKYNSPATWRFTRCRIDMARSQDWKFEELGWYLKKPELRHLDASNVVLQSMQLLGKWNSAWSLWNGRHNSIIKPTYTPPWQQCCFWEDRLNWIK